MILEGHYNMFPVGGSGARARAWLWRAACAVQACGICTRCVRHLPQVRAACAAPCFGGRACGEM